MQDTLKITYIGHATCLIQTGGNTILTDPHLGRRCLFFRRNKQIAMDMGNLPTPSVVLISHAHYDHLDVDSFKYIPSTVPIIVPAKVARAVCEFVNNPVIELAHWVPYSIADGLTITPIPVRHFGGRIVPNLRFRQVNGYHISIAGHQIYFAGDTVYGTHFKEVGNMYQLDVALLPVGNMMPGWCRLTSSLNGLETLQAFIDLKAKHCIPIHWGTFGMPSGWQHSLEQLRRHATERGVQDTVHIIAPETGFTMPDETAKIQFEANI